MKILLFTYDFPPFRGGISTYAYDLSVGLAGLGHSVSIVAPGAKWETQPRSVAVDRFRSPAGPVRRYFAGRAALRTALDRFQPDLVHAANSMAHLVCGRTPMHGVPYVVTVHGTEIGKNLIQKGAFSSVRRCMFLTSYRRASHIISVSRFVENLCREAGLDAASVSTIYNGVESRPRFYPPETLSDLRSRFDLYGKKVILTVAQLHPRKGQDRVLHALPDVIRHVPSAVYLMVGEGPSERHLRLMIRELKLEHQALLCGSFEDAGKFLGIADCVVLFSCPWNHSIEGFGLSAAEAMSYGVPVVVSDTGGLPEVVLHGESGIVVPSGDVPALARAMIDLLSDPGRAAEMGEKGRRRVESQFPLERFVRETAEVYRKVVQRSR